MTRSLMHSPWRPVLLLTVLCCALAALIAGEIGMPPEMALPGSVVPGSVVPGSTPPDPKSAGSAARAAGGTVVTPSFVPGPIDSFADIVERPLFSASRRPAPPALQAGADAPVLADTSIQLAGVILTQGRRSALLQLEGTPRPVHVEVGNEVGGWKVEAIAAERVVLRQGEKVREITIDERMKALAAMGATSRPAGGRKAQGQPERGGVKSDRPPPRRQPTEAANPRPGRPAVAPPPPPPSQ